MKKNNKKGFTIVELVVVIAVIGILAAVLIPTFSNIIEKANISADTQLCRNMNTALSTAKADGREFNNMEDVLFTINEAGYVVENLNPTTEGYYYAWDTESNQIVFLNKKLNVHYPTDANINPAKCWVTVGSSDEANKVANHGYALYLEPKLANKEVKVGSLVSVDGGATTGVDLVVNSEATGSIEIKGNFDEVEVTAKNAHVEQYGVANKVTAAVSANSFVVNGYVETLKVTAGKAVVASNGIVNTLDLSEGVDSDVKGLVVAEDDGTKDYEFTISNREELAMFRDIVNGGYNYEGKTVKLNADIDLDGTAWLPIGNFYRDTDNKDKFFAGTFDGQNHTIKNLSNIGFSVAGLNVGSNSTTPQGYSEVVYGFFGCVYNATIKNLTVEADIDMLNFDKMLGDSVGAIVGFAYGKLTMENCVATGEIKGYDAVGGLLGRRYAEKENKNYINYKVVLSNCENKAVVTGQRRAAGICGYNSDKYVAINGCINQGTVTCLGKATDPDQSKAETSGYYEHDDIINVNSEKDFEDIVAA